MKRTKLCSKCGEEKGLGEFHWRKASKDGLQYRCKVCTNKYQREYRREYSERINVCRKLWKERNKEKLKAQAKARRRRRKNGPRSAEHRRKALEYHHRHYRSDTNYHLGMVLRARVVCAVKSSQKAGSAIRDLGCSIAEFKAYIEALFQPGMTWENYGRYGWHLDHIVPLASFDLTDREQFLRAAHFTNYQPLWAEENLSKGARVPEEAVA